MPSLPDPSVHSLDRRDRPSVRTYLAPALATVQLALGVVAVLLTAFAVVVAAERSDVVEDGSGSGVFVGCGLPLGVGLLILWWTGRSRRGPKIALASVTSALAVVMLLATVLAVRPARFDLHQGLWASVWSAAVSVLLWLLITAATVVELRLRRRPVEVEPRRLWTLTAVAAPLVVIAALSVVVVLAVPSGLVRVNSRTELLAEVGPPSTQIPPDGSEWSLELEAGSSALPTTAGLAIPVPSDRDHNAGVIMVDPATGRTLWRYQLKGVDAPPELQPAGRGSAVAVLFDERGLPEEAAGRPFALDAATGQITAFWPGGDELAGSDPPVLFRHVAQGTNSVIGLAPNGRRLWTFRPDRCADPRSASSTPTVTIVRTRDCNSDGFRMLGLDAPTGEVRWDQPADGESGPDETVVRDGYQLELDSDRLTRRQLDTGQVSWSGPVPAACRDDDRTALVATTETAILAGCVDDELGTISGFDVATGERRWSQRVDGEVISIAPIDDVRTLALVRASDQRTCDLVEVTDSRSKLLKSFPEDRAASTSSNSVRCDSSRLYRVGDRGALQLALAPDEDAVPTYDTTYRFSVVG